MTERTLIVPPRMTPMVFKPTKTFNSLVGKPSGISVTKKIAVAHCGRARVKTENEPR